MRKTRSRRNRNKSEGGKRRNRNRSEGGRRKTRKMSKGADAWRDSVMRVYKEMKAKNADTQFKDALVEASRRKKAGQL